METLRKITYDILEIARGADVSKSETISLRQIEEWVHQYRALLIKQAFEKAYFISPSLIQSMNCIQLELVDKAECCGLDVDTCTVLRTTNTIPKFVRTNTGGDLLMFVGSVEGKPYQIISEQRAYWYQFRKFTANDIYAFVKNNYIYIVGSGVLERITLRGVFENPMDLISYTNSCTGSPCYDVDTEYPIPRDMLPTLKSLILKSEMGIMLELPSDKDNDSANISSPNTKKE